MFEFSIKRGPLGILREERVCASVTVNVQPDYGGHLFSASSKLISLLHLVYGKKLKKKTVCVLE